MQWDIRNEDAVNLLESLPIGEASMILADPPYASGGTTAMSRKADPITKYAQGGAKIKYRSYPGDTMDQRSWIRWMSEVARAAGHALCEGGHYLAFSDWRQLGSMHDAVQIGGLTWRGMIVWDKGLAARPPSKRHIRHQCEYITWATKGRLRYGHGPWPGCYREPCVPPRKRRHQAEKPVPLLRNLVRMTLPSELVVDPFCGSAASGEAALLEGMEYIGGDLDPESCEVARDRLKGIRDGT